MRILNNLIEVGLLPREAASADQFNKSIVIDEYVAGMHISNLGMVLLELRASTDHIVQQIPQFSLQEEAIDLPPVLDLDLEDVGVVIVGELCESKGTRTSPLEPQRPVDS